jgi:hypothetical protein
MTTDRQALLEIQRIVAEAMPPDSGATVGELLGEISGPLAEVGLDPISDFRLLPAREQPAEVIALFSRTVP